MSFPSIRIAPGGTNAFLPSSTCQCSLTILVIQHVRGRVVKRTGCKKTEKVRATCVNAMPRTEGDVGGPDGNGEMWRGEGMQVDAYQRLSYHRWIVSSNNHKFGSASALLAFLCRSTHSCSAVKLRIRESTS